MKHYIVKVLKSDVFDNYIPREINNSKHKRQYSSTNIVNIEEIIESDDEENIN